MTNLDEKGVRLAYENIFDWTVIAEKPISSLSLWTASKSRDFPLNILITFRDQLNPTPIPAKLEIIFTQVKNASFNLKLQVHLLEPIVSFNEGFCSTKAIRLFLNSQMEIGNSLGVIGRDRTLVDPDFLECSKEKDLINSFDNMKGILWEENGCMLELKIRVRVRINSYDQFHVPLARLEKSWRNFTTASGKMENSTKELQIKIVSEEGEEIYVDKSILIAASPVLKSMLTGSMLEATTGVIRLEDISTKTLKFLLHFFRSGELHPVSIEDGEDCIDKPSISEII